MRISLLRIRLSLTIVAAGLLQPCFVDAQTLSERQPSTAEMLSMPRHKIRFDDGQTWIFNGRARVHPNRYTLTGLSWPDYRFRFEFHEKVSGLVIHDNTNEYMKEHCPLGCNFRSWSPFVLVPQDEVWYPHFYEKTGTFHKLVNDRWVSFRIETTTSLSARTDEVFLTITLQNRSESALELELRPIQNGENVMSTPALSLVSDVQDTTSNGFLWNLPPKAKEVRHFALMKGAGQPVFQADLSKKVAQAYADGNGRIESIAGKLPVLQTDHEQLDSYYRRCLASMVLSRWEREDYFRNPLWLVGGYITRVAWDFSFCADALAMADPQGLQDIVSDTLAIGQLKQSWHSPYGSATHGILYIQEPFALKDMIMAHMLYTGNEEILDHQAGDLTIYEWMKAWANKLHDVWGKGPGGMIDVGYGTEHLIEIRTDGYDHVVPVVNGLAIDFYSQMAQWGKARQDPDAKIFAKRADGIRSAMNKHLWNEELGWFENMYADGSKTPIWTYHLFDILGSDVVLTQHQRSRLASHIREGEFLGELGMYGISRLDTINWDRLDADFGGGGFYAGMPPRIARHLYRHGHADIGWDILKRISKQADYFPYVPQAPSVDEPFEFWSSGNMNISCAGAMEAIWFGIFGIRPEADGSLSISPNYHRDLGEAKLTDYRFRGHSFDVHMQPEGYVVYKDGKLVSKKPYGTKTLDLL